MKCITGNNGERGSGGRCSELFNAAFGNDEIYFEKFLDYLKRLDMQVIMTESSLRENISYEKINVIELPNTNN